ncbi:MAG: MaoC family dehydratase [Candidatus Dormibacteria bacterium]
MPDQSHVGRRYEAHGQTVDADRVSAFAQAVAGGDAGYAEGEIPSTFAAVYCLYPTLGQVFGDPEVGINLAGLVHGEQEFRWPNPVRLGDTIDATATIASVEEKRGLTFVGIDLTAVNQGGLTVCNGRSLMIIRGGAG